MTKAQLRKAAKQVAAKGRKAQGDAREGQFWKPLFTLLQLKDLKA
jgi:hypothetical protein